MATRYGQAYFNFNGMPHIAFQEDCDIYNISHIAVLQPPCQMCGYDGISKVYTGTKTVVCNYGCSHKLGTYSHGCKECSGIEYFEYRSPKGLSAEEIHALVHFIELYRDAREEEPYIYVETYRDEYSSPDTPIHQWPEVGLHPRLKELLESFAKDSCTDEYCVGTKLAVKYTR